MANIIFTFEPRVHFLGEKQTKPYTQYGAGGIAGKKCAVGQKVIQCNQHCWLTGRTGV